MNVRAGYDIFVSESRAFEEYYKKQGIVGDDEWEAFNDAIHRPLPTTFRINARSPLAQSIREQLHEGFSDKIKQHIKPLAWYPHELAWELTFSRSELRNLPELQRIQEFLKLQHELGNIARQEAVSMIPPLFLDMQADHHVLDMCAAPGSKTFQLLEIIHTNGTLSSGLVIANDFDVQRCHLLVHHMKRISSPNILVTKHDGQHFPGLRKRTLQDNTEHETGLSFDRVLCDVPCSGDGTLRKAPVQWKNWNPIIGNGYHSLQVQISMRGVAHLKAGGRMVYSTCSLNPIENEAVVAEILRQSDGSVELLDVSFHLPTFKRRAGLSSWKVQGSQGWLTCYDESSGVLPSMFPSGTRDLPLERCMRFLPHDQDTGGFFIAVFEKVKPFICMSRTMFERRMTTRAAVFLDTGTGKKVHKQEDDPVLFLEDEETIDNLVSFYGIQDTLCLTGHLIIRNRDISQVRRIYYVSRSAGDVLRMNFQTGETLKVTSAGVKVFERHSNREYASACPFRIASEGLSILLPHLSKQVLFASEEDFKLLLSSSLVRFASFHDKDLIRAVESLTVGCCVVLLKESGSGDGTAVACWRGRANMSLLVSKIEADEMLQRL